MEAAKKQSQSKPNKLVPSSSPLGASSGQALSNVEWSQFQNRTRGRVRITTVCRELLAGFRRQKD